MDLKSVFSDEALSYEQFCEKISEKGMELADLTDGSYVPRGEYEKAVCDAGNSAEQLKAGYEKEIQSLKTSSAIDLALLRSGALDLVSVRAHIDPDSVKLDENGLSGLDEQIESLRTGCPYLFGSAAAEAPAECTGLRLSSGMEHSHSSPLDYSALTDSEYYGIMERRAEQK